MSDRRDKAIEAYLELKKHNPFDSMEERDKYYDTEAILLPLLDVDVLILDDGETCVYEYDSSICTRKLLK